MILIGKYPADDSANIAWARDGWTASDPFGHHGRVYLNFPGHGEDGNALTRVSFGSNYQRLAKIKAKFDPTMEFALRVGQNECSAIYQGRAFRERRLMPKRKRKDDL